MIAQTTMTAIPKPNAASIFLDIAKKVHMPKNKDKEQEIKIKQYIEQMTDRERKAYNIAIEDLQTSFDVVKCIGYQNWLKNNKFNIIIHLAAIVPTQKVNNNSKKAFEETTFFSQNKDPFQYQKFLYLFALCFSFYLYFIYTLLMSTAFKIRIKKAFYN